MTLDTPPAVQPASQWRFPTAQESTLGGGVRVLALHCPDQYVAAVSLVFPFGLTAEPRGREGVAGLMARCLTLGAGGRDAEELADALARCGADLDAAAGSEAFTVRLDVPLTHLEEGLRLLADVVARPVLDADELEHERDQRLEEIRQSAAYPQRVASEHLDLALFGDTREGRPPGGTADTVAAVERRDVVDLWERLVRPSAGVTLVIGGDLHGVDAIGAARSALGAWAEGPGPQPTAVQDEADLRSGPRVVVVDRPGSPQTTIRIAGPAVTRADERWGAMFVANHAVGGSFSSRLNTVLREQKGLTYGVGSGVDSSSRHGVIIVGTAVRAGATAEAVRDLVDGMRTARGSITEGEVADGVRASSDSAALGFERSDAVVGRVELLLAHDLPLSHVDDNLARIRSLTADDVNQVYGSVVPVDALTVVCVGDAELFRADLETWGYGPVTVVDAPGA